MSSKKAASGAEAETLQQIPNIGSEIEKDFHTLGIRQPKDLMNCDPYELYERLNIVTSMRHDPCVLDVFIAATRFMDGSPPVPWWVYTEERKRRMRKN